MWREATGKSSKNSRDMIKPLETYNLIAKLNFKLEGRYRTRLGQTDKTGAKYGITPYKLFREALETPKTIQALAIPLECPPELDSETLLPKLPHTLTA